MARFEIKCRVCDKTTPWPMLQGITVEQFASIDIEDCDDQCPTCCILIPYAKEDILVDGVPWGKSRPSGTAPGTQA